MKKYIIFGTIIFCSINFLEAMNNNNTPPSSEKEKQSISSAMETESSSDDSEERESRSESTSSTPSNSRSDSSSAASPTNIVPETHTQNRTHSRALLRLGRERNDDGTGSNTPETDSTPTLPDNNSPKAKGKSPASGGFWHNMGSTIAGAGKSVVNGIGNMLHRTPKQMPEEKTSTSPAPERTTTTDSTPTSLSESPVSTVDSDSSATPTDNSSPQALEKNSASGGFLHNMGSTIAGAGKSVMNGVSKVSKDVGKMLHLTGTPGTERKFSEEKTLLPNSTTPAPEIESVNNNQLFKTKFSFNNNGIPGGDTNSEDSSTKTDEEKLRVFLTPSVPSSINRAIGVSRNTKSPFLNNASKKNDEQTAGQTNEDKPLDKATIDFLRQATASLNTTDSAASAKAQAGTRRSKKGDVGPLVDVDIDPPSAAPKTNSVLNLMKHPIAGVKRLFEKKESASNSAQSPKGDDVFDLFASQMKEANSPKMGNDDEDLLDLTPSPAGPSQQPFGDNSATSDSLQQEASLGQPSIVGSHASDNNKTSDETEDEANADKKKEESTKTSLPKDSEDKH